MFNNLYFCWWLFEWMMVYLIDEVVIFYIVYRFLLSFRILMLYLFIFLVLVKSWYNVLRYYFFVLIVSLVENNFVEYCVMCCFFLVWVCVFDFFLSYRWIKVFYCNCFCNCIYLLVGDWFFIFSMVLFVSFIVLFLGFMKWMRRWILELIWYV